MIINNWLLNTFYLCHRSVLMLTKEPDKDKWITTLEKKLLNHACLSTAKGCHISFAYLKIMTPARWAGFQPSTMNLLNLIDVNNVLNVWSSLNLLQLLVIVIVCSASAVMYVFYQLVKSLGLDSSRTEKDGFEMFLWWNSELLRGSGHQF